MYENLPLILTGLGLTASVLYYTMTLRNANNTRQTQLFMQVYERFQDQTFIKMWNELMNRSWDSPEDYLAKYGGWDDTALSVQTYFEGIGVLLMKNVIDADFVYELMPTMVNTLWSKYEPIVRNVRESVNYPQFWRPVEYLKDRMVEVAKMKGDPVLFEYSRKQAAG